MAKKKKISFVIVEMSKEDGYILSYKVNGITQEAPRRKELADALGLIGYYVRTEAKGQEEINIKIIQNTLPKE